MQHAKKKVNMEKEKNHTYTHREQNPHQTIIYYDSNMKATI